MQEETVFHKIVRGEVPCHKVWEDEKFLAFLSIFPNTEGTTVVIPKMYQPSYFADANDEILSELILASKKVAKLLDSKLDNVGRTALVFEGFGVNYLHAKLFPMHGTGNMSEWKPIESQGLQDVYFEKYPGYISSHDAKEEDGVKLAKLSERLRS
jgi:diadenosine tetraphosphate (Ap4A) HIT family hydrolase